MKVIVLYDGIVKIVDNYILSEVVKKRPRLRVFDARKSWEPL
jgi:hypothetical protein